MKRRRSFPSFGFVLCNLQFLYSAEEAESKTLRHLAEFLSAIASCSTAAARESKLGVTSTTSSSAARLRDGPPLSISRMQDRQKYKAANSARAPATEGAFNDYVDTILSFFDHLIPTYLGH